MIGNRPGESPFFVTKKFTLQQSIRQCRTIDCDKGFPGPLRVIMDVVGKQFLPGSAFTLNQDRRLTFRNILGDIHEIQHFLVLGNDFLARFSDSPLNRFGFPFKRNHRTGVSLESQGTFDQEKKGIEVDRFFDVIECPVLHRLHCGFHRRIGGCHDHRLGGIQTLDVLQQFQPTPFGHGHVCDHHRIVIFLIFLESVDGVVGQLDGIPTVLQGLRHRNTHFHFVVNNQNRVTDHVRFTFSH